MVGRSAHETPGISLASRASMDKRITAARIEICGIELIGFHGCYEQEKMAGNVFSVNLRVEGDFHSSFSSDRLEESVDYSKLVQLVRDVNKERRYFLIESLADSIANSILERFPKIDRIGVRVEKMAPMGLGKVRCAAVEMEKEREK